MESGNRQKSQYEGLQENILRLKTPEIETWSFQYPGSNTEIVINIPEFTCICPKTGQPDFALISIKYKPDASCLELKSLKNYLLFYRDIGIFHEHVVNKLLLDCVRACNPLKMEIRGEFNARGGIQTTASAYYPSE